MDLGLVVIGRESCCCVHNPGGFRATWTEHSTYRSRYEPEHFGDSTVGCPFLLVVEEFDDLIEAGMTE
jgi:hypothetical protein